MNISDVARMTQDSMLLAYYGQYGSFLESGTIADQQRREKFDIADLTRHAIAHLIGITVFALFYYLTG